MSRFLKSRGSLFCFLAILTWTAVQSVMGLIQLLGICPSNNPMYTVTGSFNNPGPYGGFIAIGMAASMAWLVLIHPIKWKDYSIIDKTITVLSLMVLFIGILVLPSTFSRAAWLAFAISIFVLLMKESSVLHYLKRHRLLAFLSVLIILLVASGVFLLKPMSALGRLHIWRIESLSIMEKPFTGHGSGSILVSYSDTQAKFFQTKERSNLTVQVAGCPEYAFNEYLKIGVEYGIPAMAVFIVLVVLSVISLIRNKSPLGYGLIVLAVFALFSYPLSIWQFKAIGLLLLATVVPDSGKLHYLNILTLCATVTSSVLLIMNKPKPKENEFRHKYVVGYALHQEGKYGESNRLLKEGAAISSDPMFHIIIGKNLEAMGDVEGAGREYLHAHYMVPCRLYPLVLLMEMEVRLGNHAQAIEYADMAIGLHVNKKNPNMVELHNRALVCADSLKSPVIINDLLSY